MKKLIIIVLLLLTSCDYALVSKTKTEEQITIALEKAYFEGQRDAINGDIRIKLSKDSVYNWIKSPWNESTKPIYNPTYLDTKN